MQIAREHRLRGKLEELALVGISIVGTAIVFVASWTLGSH
jgi:hypothetical protein